MNRILCRLLFLVCLPGPLSAQQIFPEAQEPRIQQLIEALHQQPWPGAWNLGNPAAWMFNFSEPMKLLLEVGAPAQKPLLERISDSAITDQIIILLGGVGDELSIGPIIEAMTTTSSQPPGGHRARILTAGNIALTNITVADVIWHYGGGLTRDACPDDPAGCWSKWWHGKEATFHVKDIKQGRRYVNYPNYGIYRDLP